MTLRSAAYRGIDAHGAFAEMGATGQAEKMERKPEAIAQPTQLATQAVVRTSRDIALSFRNRWCAQHRGSHEVLDEDDENEEDTGTNLLRHAP